MSEPLTTDQLREEIVNKVLDEIAGKYDNPHGYMDAIMAAVKDHVDYVIGEDVPGETNVMIASEHAAQRNRSGVY